MWAHLLPGVGKIAGIFAVVLLGRSRSVRSLPSRLLGWRGGRRG